MSRGLQSIESRLLFFMSDESDVRKHRMGKILQCLADHIAEKCAYAYFFAAVFHQSDIGRLYGVIEFLRLAERFSLVALQFLYPVLHSGDHIEIVEFLVFMPAYHMFLMQQLFDDLQFFHVIECSEIYAFDDAYLFFLPQEIEKRLDDGSGGYEEVIFYSIRLLQYFLDE